MFPSMIRRAHTDFSIPTKWPADSSRVFSALLCLLCRQWMQFVLSLRCSLRGQSSKNGNWRRSHFSKRWLRHAPNSRRSSWGRWLWMTRAPTRCGRPCHLGPTRPHTVSSTIWFRTVELDLCEIRTLTHQSTSDDEYWWNCLCLSTLFARCHSCTHLWSGTYG